MITYVQHLTEHLWDVALVSVGYSSSQGKECMGLPVDKTKKENLMCYIISLRNEAKSTLVCQEGEISLALNSKRVVKSNSVVITETIETFSQKVKIQIP